MNKILPLMIALTMSGCSSLNDQSEQSSEDPITPFLTEELAFDRGEYVEGSIFAVGGNTLLVGAGQSYQIGDIVNVEMEESIDAQDSVKSKMNQKSSYSSSAGLILPAQLGDINASLSGDVETDKKVSGDGSSSQSHSIEGSIACTVTKVYPNGVLEIKGNKRITLEKGSEWIGITGYIRQQDIATTTNTIRSSRIANAQIYYRGEGKMYEQASEGWLTNFIGGKWWFF